MASKNPAVKHLFWILAGLAWVFITLACLLMFVLVGGDIQAANKKKEEQKSAARSAQPKTNGEIASKKDEVELLDTGVKTLGARNYQEQADAGVFDWPTSSNALFNEYAKAKFKFGENETGEFRVVSNVTSPKALETAFGKGGYERVAESLAPTRFAKGSYPTALRVVTEWGKLPTVPVPAIWLALEDFWVQRGLLDPIVKLNAAAAVYEDVTPKEKGKDAPLPRTFRNRVWELDLDIGPKEVLENGKKVTRTAIGGQLRNRTTRLQLLGANKTMKVKVWLKPEAAKAKPADLPEPDVEYVIRGEAVTGRGSLACPPQALAREPARDARISRVEQVFDEATVPVRLVNTVELGTAALDHKNRTATLETPSFIEAESTGEDTTNGNTTPGLGPMITPGGVPPMPGLGDPSTPGTPQVVRGSKTGRYENVTLGNKARYLKRTADVRRMPVAVSVVIDADFVNDLMIAYANSPLHLQITQTQWARYKGPLPPVGAVPTTPGTLPDGQPGPEAGPEAGPGPGPKGGAAVGPVIDVPPMTPSGGTGPGPYVPGMGTTPATGNQLPTEANAGLCEVAVFGVVSLYEKVPPPEKKLPEGVPPKADDPTKTDPMNPDPTPGDPKPEDKKPADPTAPDGKRSEGRPEDGKPADPKPTDPAKPEDKKPGEPKGPAQTPPPDSR